MLRILSNVIWKLFLFHNHKTNKLFDGSVFKSMILNTYMYHETPLVYSISYNRTSFACERDFTFDFPTLQRVILVFAEWAEIS